MSGYSGKSVRPSEAFPRCSRPRPSLRRAATSAVRVWWKTANWARAKYTRDARDSRRNQAESKSSNFPLNSRAQISDGSGGRFRTVPEIIQSVRSRHYGHIEQERWSGDVLGGSEAVSAALLVARPSARVTAYACYVVAGMFVVFAVWAAPGFALPEEPRPLALAEFSSSSSSLRADFRPSCPRPGTGRFDGYLADWHWRCGCQP